MWGSRKTSWDGLANKKQKNDDYCLEAAQNSTLFSLFSSPSENYFCRFRPPSFCKVIKFSEKVQKLDFVSLSDSVIRLTDYLFNIWPFPRMKINPNIVKHCESRIILNKT